MKFPQIAICKTFLQPRFAVLRETLLGIFIALCASVFLTLVAHFWIGVGLHPETIFAIDWLAPLLGTFSGACWVAQRASESRGWKVGFRIAFSLVILWFVAFAYLMARFDFANWPRQVFAELDSDVFWAWSLALFFGVVGGMIGEKTRRKRRSNFILALCVLGIVPFSMQIFHWSKNDVQPNFESETQLAKGATLRVFPPTDDGTTVRFLAFNLAQNPDFIFGIYDADSDDARTFDDKNTSWLGASLHRVLDKTQHRVGANSDVLCLVNGGFFGAQNSWTATHEAPIVVEGKLRYDAHTLEHDWPEQAGALTIQKSGARFYFGFVRQLTPQNAPLFQTALGGVRGLIIDGKAQNLKPGMGGTQLRCSRTSVGWTNDSRHFYILSVRDMDGERASLQQRAQQKIGVGTPVGGWDAAQVQRFWQNIKVPNAVLFDGGESTQLAYKQSDGNHRFISSAYQISRTFGYWNGRPLRAYLPLLPPEPNHGGVLNYFYIAAPK